MENRENFGISNFNFNFNFSDNFAFQNFVIVSNGRFARYCDLKNCYFDAMEKKSIFRLFGDYLSENINTNWTLMTVSKEIFTKATNILKSENSKIDYLNVCEDFPEITRICFIINFSNFIYLLHLILTFSLFFVISINWF